MWRLSSEHSIVRSERAFGPIAPSSGASGAREKALCPFASEKFCKDWKKWVEVEALGAISWVSAANRLFDFCGCQNQLLEYSFETAVMACMEDLTF
jgi:hypothetical protein